MSKNVPDVRLKGFTEEWKSNKLKNLAKFSKGSGYTKQDLVNSGTPIILYGRLYTAYASIISKVDTFAELRSNSVVSEGNEVIVPSSGESAEDIARASFVEMPGIILGGDLNIIKPGSSISPNFLSLTISNGNQKKALAKRAQGKSIVHLHNSDLKEVILIYPLLEEQQEIGKFFKQLDDTIHLQEQLVKQQQQYKKALLQKMLPQKGERVPKVRFYGFSGEWEETRLSSLFESRNIKQIPTTEAPLMAFTSTGGVEEKGERFNREFLVKDKNKTYKRTELNDLIYSSNNLDVGAIGRNKYGTAVISDVYEIFQTKKSTTPEFSEIIIKQKSFLNKVLKYRQGALYGQYRIYASDFLSVNILIPSYKEQQKIGDFFKQLDDTIALHQKKLEDYQQLKKALLQRMFV